MNDVRYYKKILLRYIDVNLDVDVFLFFRGKTERGKRFCELKDGNEAKKRIEERVRDVFKADATVGILRPSQPPRTASLSVGGSVGL
jgi:hypothetical protein